MVDRFVLLNHVQFEKNGYQNRYSLSNGKWVTKSVKHGLDLIVNKQYADGKSLNMINIMWIRVIKETLSIETELIHDYKSNLPATEKLIELVKLFGGDTYVTNSEAKNKYLNEDLMRQSGIDIEYCKVPKHLQKHTFEIFEEYGIDGAIKQLPKVKNVQLASVL